MSNNNVPDNTASDSDIELIFKNIIQFINEKEYNEKIQTRINSDDEILKIYSNNCSLLHRTKSAASEILDMSYSSAEHHPYWMLLYNASEIVKSVLDAWDSKLSNDQISEFNWRLEEMKSTLDRISEY